MPVGREQFEGAGWVLDPLQVRGMQAGSSARLQRAGDVRLAIRLLFLEGE